MSDLYLFYPDLIDYRCHILLTEEEAALPEAHWIVTDWIYQETATQYVVLGKRTPTQDTLWSENTCVKEPRPAPETWEFNCYYLPTGTIDNRVLLAHSHATVPQCEFGAPECFYTFHFGPLFVQQGQWYLSEWMHPK